MKRIKFFIVLIVLLSVTVLMTACNTVNGIGKDLQNWTEPSVAGSQQYHQQRQQHHQPYQNTSQY